MYVVMVTPLTPANCSFWSDVNLHSSTYCHKRESTSKVSSNCPVCALESIE